MDESRSEVEARISGAISRAGQLVAQSTSALELIEHSTKLVIDTLRCPAAIFWRSGKQDTFAVFENAGDSQFAQSLLAREEFQRIAEDCAFAQRQRPISSRSRNGHPDEIVLIPMPVPAPHQAVLAVDCDAESIPAVRNFLCLMAAQIGLSMARWVLEREVDALKNDLANANQVRREFFATLSHELRAPLTPIMTWSQILSRQAKLERRWQRAVDVIQRNARHQARLIDDLLDVMLVRHGELHLNRRRTDLAGQLRLAIDSAQSIVQRPDNSQIRVELPNTALEIEVDPSRFQQAVSKIVASALHNSDGGQVEVRVTEDLDEIRIDVMCPRGGFDAGESGSIFEVLGNASGGEGDGGRLTVGLALARHLIEEHGGRVTARSAGRGKGFAYEIVLPALAGADRHETIATSLKGVDVLVIEDHEDTREALEILLESRQAHVRSAANGIDGVAAALQKRPDIVLCDLGLPGIDGYEVAQRLRRVPALASIPILALTGYGMEIDRERTRAAGFTAHLVKPVEAGELIDRIAEARRASNPA